MTVDNLLTVLFVCLDVRETTLNTEECISVNTSHTGRVDSGRWDGKCISGGR